MNARQKPSPWPVELSVGIPIIDDDHGRFLDLSNQLQSMINSGSIELSDLEEILLNIEYCVDGHFIREESFLSLGPRDEYVYHKYTHDCFRKTIKDLADRCRNKDEAAVRALPEVLSSWIIDHTRTVDRQFERWVRLDDVDTRPLEIRS